MSAQAQARRRWRRRGVRAAAYAPADCVCHGRCALAGLVSTESGCAWCPACRHLLGRDVVRGLHAAAELLVHFSEGMEGVVGRSSCGLVWVPRRLFLADPTMTTCPACKPAALAEAQWLRKSAKRAAGARLIFLDLDGVLNHGAFSTPRPWLATGMTKPLIGNAWHASTGSSR